MKVCHIHRRHYRRINFYRYLTKSCKIFTVFYHIHRRHYRRINVYQYLTESCKIFTAFATITDRHTDVITDVRCKFQCAQLSECQVGRSVYRRTHRRILQFQCVCALTPRYQQNCRRKLKILEGFPQILVRNSKYTDGNYRLNLMPPPKKILF